jgi:hypothetical protein
MADKKYDHLEEIDRDLVISRDAIEQEKKRVREVKIFKEKVEKKK